MRRLYAFDWTLALSVFIFLTASLVALGSSAPNLAVRQAVWAALGICIIIAGRGIPWTRLMHQSWFRYGLYCGTLLLLIVSHLQRETVRGTKSWISLGPFQFQPAEFAKIALIVLLAGFLSKRHVSLWHAKNLSLSFFFAITPALLIAFQPDFGGAAVIMSIWIAFLFVGGANLKRLSVGILIALIAGILSWMFLFRPYQKDRITAFFFPERDPLGASYNVIQSKIAIGSAGLWGKGFGEGTQARLGFLPEATSDFLFAAFVEEWGLVSGIALIAVFLLMMWRITRVGLRANNNTYKFIVLGSGVVIAIQFLLNTGSNLGLVPVTGISLPFFSYGGSNLLTFAFLVSIIEHIKLESS